MSSQLIFSPKQNRILAALGIDDFACIQSDLELVTLLLGEVLYEPGDKLTHVYFPVTCIVSLMFNTLNGASAELAMTGNDGFVGLPLVLGCDTASQQLVVQSTGAAYRLQAEVMRWELDQGGELQRLALLYIQALMTQMSQSVVCNRHHTVDQQLCRWLLLSLDLLPGSQINMTQALIANMLGVRREAVTEAAGKLQAGGVIKYSRGRIDVIDRPGLEARACECYGVVKAAYNRLFQITTDVRVKNRARTNPATLYQRAEQQLLRKVPLVVPQSGWDNAQLVHQLQVHQVELEMQNQALRGVYEEADFLRERYADLYDFSPVGYVTLNALGGILDLNLAGAILLGIKRSEKSRYRFAAFLTPEHLAAFKQFFDAVLQAKNKQVCEFVLSANPQRPAATVKIEAVTDEGGRECRMVIIDISAEKAAENEIREREQYKQALLENFPFMVWLKDEESRFLAVNNAFAAVFGWPSPESMIGKSDLDIVPKELAELYRADDFAVMTTGEKINRIERIEVHGERRTFETHKSPVSLDGQRIGTVGFSRDVTEWQNNAHALERAEKQSRSLIENLPLSAVVIQDGMLKYINPKGVEIIGYSAEECVGKSFLPLVFEDDRGRVWAIHQQRVRGETAPNEYEVRLLSNTGRVIDCRLHVNLVEWAGEPATLGIFEDVTEFKSMESELRRLATTDELTELPNRRYFLARVDEAFSRLQRDVDHQVVVLMLDLDHFKAINDGFGHSAGDTVLRHFAALLRDELRKVDIVGRVGGEEFAVLLPEEDLAAAGVFAERLRQKVANMVVMIGHQPVLITASIGIAAMRAEDKSSEQALFLADQALYQAKAQGRNCIAFAAVDGIKQEKIKIVE